MRLNLFRTVLFAFLTASLASCSGFPLYIAAPIKARVVDAESDQPIAGANVVASWHLLKSSLDGSRHVGYLEVMETVTDANGQFSFPGFTKTNATSGELRNEDPAVLIFKPGYKAERVINHHTGTTAAGSNTVAAVNGKTVRLTKLKMDYSDKNAQWYWAVDTVLRQLIEDCEWKKIPLAIVAMDKERKRIEKIDSWFPTSLPSVEVIELHSKNRCGSAIEFLRDYTK